MKLIILGAGDLLTLILSKVNFEPFKIDRVFLSDVRRDFDIKYLKKHNFPVDKAFIESKSFKSKLKVSAPDLVLCIGVREILSKETISIPRLGVVNLHGALLPLQRGAGGDYGSFVNDKLYGLSTHFMDAGIDSGQIIFSKFWQIKNKHSKKDMIAKGHKALPKIIENTLKRVLDKSFESEVQKEYCYYPRKPDWDEFIDWSENSQLLFDKIRARNPGPLNFTIYNGKVLFIYKAEMIDFIKPYIAPCGQVIGNIKNKGTIVKTGDTAILLTKVGYGDSEMTYNRQKWPYKLPSKTFTPKFPISKMLGVNIYKKYYDLLERVKTLEEKLAEKY